MNQYYLNSLREAELQVGLAKVGYELAVKEYGNKIANATSIEEGKKLIEELNKVVDAFNAMVEHKKYLEQSYRDSVGGDKQ